MSRLDRISKHRSWQCTPKTLRQATKVGFGGCDTVGRDTTHYQPPFAIADPEQSKRHYSQSVIRRKSLLEHQRSPAQMAVDAAFIRMIARPDSSEKKFNLNKSKAEKKNASEITSAYLHGYFLGMMVSMMAFWIWIAMDLEANLAAVEILSADSSWAGSQSIVDRMQLPTDNMAGMSLIIGTMVSIAGGMWFAAQKMM